MAPHSAPPAVRSAKPLAVEVPFFDPVAAFAPFEARPFAQLLHSSPAAPGGGRYSYILLDPFETFSWKDRQGVRNGETVVGSPFETLRKILLPYRQQDCTPGLPPFQGGCAGYFAYELAHQIEQIRPQVVDDLGVPDIVFGLYDVCAAVDWQTERAWIISTGWPERRNGPRQSRAAKRAAWLQELLFGAEQTSYESPHWAALAVAASPDKEEFIEIVRRTVDYIHAGDIFQANVSRRYEVEIPEHVSAYDLFRQLTKRSPVSYSGYMRLPGLTLISNSPEQFMSVTNKAGRSKVSTRPIKGTAPRHESAAEDNRSIRALSLSEKDRAENTMIVDLMRNDLSKSCIDDSVAVTALCEVESYRGVHHLVSEVTGVLHDDKDLIDLLAGAFPGGSITGAPKVRAMEVIAELEGRVRGAYCGSICMLGFNGSMQSNIAIRTLSVLEQTGGHRRGIFGVGGGIVADSDPLAEYEETVSKAQAFLEILEGRDALSRPIHVDKADAVNRPRTGNDSWRQGQNKSKTLSTGLRIRQADTTTNPVVLIDNYDSFVHNLARHVRQLGLTTEIIRNDDLTTDDILSMDPIGIILSPGPCTPREAGICLDLISAAAMDVPVLGICLGHQCLAQAYGGRVRRAPKAVHGKASHIIHDGRGIFQNVPNPLNVGRYHSLIATLAPDGPLVPTAWTNETGHSQMIMGLAHRARPQVGLQFHPESLLTDHGYDLLANFLDFAIGWRRSQQVAGEAAQ